LEQPILNGRDSVRKVLETFRERGGVAAEIANSYYGPVIENFDCEKSIYTAVEVTAGNRSVKDSFDLYVFLILGVCVLLHVLDQYSLCQKHFNK
jgi:hypothetical protein